MYLKTSHPKFQYYGAEVDSCEKTYKYTKVVKVEFGEIISFYYKSNSSVQLKLIDGIGMIAVSNDGSLYKLFSFYRPVSIRPEIKFNLVCISGSLSYKIYYNDLEEIPSSQQIEYKPIRENFLITEIIGYYYIIRDTNYVLKNVKNGLWEVYFVEYGALTIMVDKTKYVLYPNNFIFASPNQEISINTKELNLSCSYMVIIFKANIQEEDMLIDEVFKMDVNIRQLITDFLRFSKRIHYMDDDLMIHYLSLIILKILREKLLVEDEKHENSILSQLKYSGEDLSSMLRYIEKNVSKRITVDDLCKQFGLSKSLIYKLFNDNLGISPIKYINNQRMILAATLIRTNKYSITEIASILNFGSIHHFSKSFKNFHKITPSEFVKSL